MLGELCGTQESCSYLTAELSQQLIRYQTQFSMGKERGAVCLQKILIHLSPPIPHQMACFNQSEELTELQLMAFDFGCDASAPFPPPKPVLTHTKSQQ